MKRLGKMAVGIAAGFALNAGICASNPAPTPRSTPPGSPDALSAVDTVSNTSTRSTPPGSPVPLSKNEPEAPKTPNPLSRKEPAVPMEEKAAPDEPYAAIPARNLFGLLPPVPPQTTKQEDPAKDLPKIKPQGIMGIFGDYQVLFTLTPAKPDPKAKEEYYNLHEGEMADDIEVKKIDNASSLITFINHGIEQTLPLVKETPSGGGAAAPSGGTHTPTFMPTPAMPGLTGGGNPNGVINFGGRRGRGGAGGPGPAGGGPDANNGQNSFGGVAPSNLGPAANLPPINPDNQELMIAAQHLKAIQNNDPSSPLWPPTSIDQEAGIPSSEAPPSPPGPPGR